MIGILAGLFGRPRPYGRPARVRTTIETGEDSLRPSPPALGAPSDADGLKAELFELRWTSPGAYAILQERLRQKYKEGFTDARDDAYKYGELARAAAVYALLAAYPNGPGWIASIWPWSYTWLKNGTKRRMLEKAGALIAAEIDRLDRKGDRT